MSLRENVVGRFLKARSDKDWVDGDPGAPKTPWGPAQSGWQLERGVWWFSTASHGGLMVSPTVAAKRLSGAARKMAEKWGGSFWFEEDIAWTMAFYEVPEWDAVFTRKAGGTRQMPAQLEDTIRRYFPQYFKLKEEGYQAPRLPKPGDWLEFKDSLRFRDGKVFQPGDKVFVVQVTRSVVKFQIRPDSYGTYIMRTGDVLEGKAVKVD